MLFFLKSLLRLPWGVSGYTPPQPVGTYKNLAVPRRSMQLVDRVLTDLSTKAGRKPPLRGTIPGRTSVYRWNPKDIMMSEVLLREGSDEQIKKITAHEWFHSDQAAKGKIMPLTFIREPEAEHAALRYAVDGVIENIPRFGIIHPKIFFENRMLTSRFMPGASASVFTAFESRVVYDIDWVRVESEFHSL